MKTDFIKGIHTDTKPIHTPPGYYPDAENMRIDGRSKKTEEGNIRTGVPTNLVQWGDCSIAEETIILGNISGKSIIGAMTDDGSWTEIIGARSVDVLGINEPTQVVGKKNWAGERVIYFSTTAGSRRINLDKPQPTDNGDFDKSTSLFLEYDLPQVEYTGESDTGQLLSGVYQVAARLITDSGAATSFGIASSVIPVVQDSLQSSRQSIEGAPPQTQTSKAINITINNVDNTFRYLQLGVLTYKGVSNTPVVTASTLIPINNQSTVNYTYRGAQDDIDTISLEEFIVSGVAYTTGKYLDQKDGTLIIAAPVEAEQPQVDWYRVAAGMTADFVVKRIAYKENLTFKEDDYNDRDKRSLVETSSESMSGEEGYKNPITCTLYKGYRRNEVYGFTLTPVYTSGVLGPTVHIPAKASIQTDATNHDGNPNNGGVLGTFVSLEEYTEDSYPGIDVGDGLRFHKFPDTDIQPMIEGNVETGNCFIRVLGVKFGNIVLDASEADQASLIAGYIIGRLNRVGNETQLAQGIVRLHADVIYSGDVYAQSTTLGDGFIKWYNNTVRSESSYTGKLDTTLQYDNFNFIAPDIIHGLYAHTRGSKIKQHSAFAARPYLNSALRIEHNPHEDGYAAVRNFFKNITGAPTTPLTQPEKTGVVVDGNRNLIQPFGVPLAPESLGGKEEFGFPLDAYSIKMCSSDGMVFMKTTGDPIQFKRPDGDFYYNSKQQCDGTGSGDANDNRARQELIEELGSNPEVTFILHSMVAEDPKQYGALAQQVSMYVDFQSWQDNTDNGNSVEFFNGDTFINKYGLSINDEGPFPWPTTDDGGSPNAIGRMRPPNASGIVYFWLESSNNYAYRHYLQPTSYNTENISGSGGTTPYFPAYKQLISHKIPMGILNMHAENWPRPGYASQYNNQYTAQPNIKPYVVTPKEDTENKASLVNRIIYSAQAVQGEKADGYQIFLPNNYYDVPQEFGDLTDVYVSSGELYASTAQVQWRLFYNTLATQATSVGEIVLGTGGAFNRPGVPMATVDGGYGGTSHWLHAINTVYGRIIVDRLQGKFFLMQENLAVFSGDLNSTNKLLVQNLRDVDILVGSEPLHDRVFIKTGNLMWSYNIPQKVFTSRHTYFPRWMFSHGPYMFSNNLDSAQAGSAGYGVFKHSVGKTGIFFDKLHQSSITLSVNAEFTMSKLFKSMEILTKRTTEAGLNIPLQTFNKMQAWNMERNTGLLTIVPRTNSFQQPGILEVMSNKVNDTFRVLISRDIVKDPAKNIFAPSNLAQNKGDTTLAKWLPRMRGTYIEVKLITDNTQGPLYVFDVLVEASQNIR